MTAMVNMASDRTGKFLFGALLLFIGLFVAYFLLATFAPESPLLTLGQEDQPLEYLGALFWAATIVLCAYRLIKRQEPKLLLALWLVLTILFLGEEISWFQRIFGFETPEAVRAVNAQNEFNLHNLEGLGGRIVNIQNMFRLGFFVYFLVFPALTLSDRVRSWAARVGYVRPGGAYMIMVWGVIAVSVLLQVAVPDEGRRALVETRESFYAFSVLLYVFLYLRPEALTRERETRDAVPA